MFDCLHGLIYRRAIAAALAVCLALFLQYAIGASGGWMVFSAFLVCQTTQGTALKRSVNYFFVVMLIAMVLPPYAMDVMKARLMDAAIGGVIGIVCGQLILPTQFFAAFSRGLQPVLAAMLADLDVLAKVMVNDDPLNAKKLLLLSQTENVLGGNDKAYPEWVYEVGFNPGLRNGYRFFLLNIERLAEIIFSLNYLTFKAVQTPLLAELQNDIVIVMRTNESLVLKLSQYFTEQQSSAIQLEEDLVSDMRELELALNRSVPPQLALLDIAPEYLIMTALVRDLKDAREILLQLMMALPVVKE